MNLRRDTIFDVIIIGGGLSGIMSALTAEKAGISALLIDEPVDKRSATFGGFAPFSGAKFSLFPAGSGLLPLVEGESGLIERYRGLCQFYENIGIGEFAVSDDELVGRTRAAPNSLAFRSYFSVLLTPDRMNCFIDTLVGRLKHTKFIRAKVHRIDLSSDRPQLTIVTESGNYRAVKVIVAAGRYGAKLLGDAGVSETSGKGIDVGIRLSFNSTEPLRCLRALGPDAKILNGRVRTFCLNSPGRIYHYNGLGYAIPGGIVAEPGWRESNVGILLRVANRPDTLAYLEAQSSSAGGLPLCHSGCGNNLQWTEAARHVLGDEAIFRISSFVTAMADSGLIDLPPDYVVHYPLLDWFWPVFAEEGSLRTSEAGVYVAGDVSGHARGLMQAALMGILAIEEAFR